MDVMREDLQIVGSDSRRCRERKKRMIRRKGKTKIGNPCLFFTRQLRSPLPPICHQGGATATRVTRKADPPQCLLSSNDITPAPLSARPCLSSALSSPSPCQIAVSHTTACGLWQGGVPVLRGSGVRLQLGRMGMLSCLHRLLSGRLWALISLQRQRLRSMTSSNLPSLRVCAADEAAPAPAAG